MYLSKIGVIAFHVIVASGVALFVGWAVSIEGVLGSFTFWAGAFMGAISYLIFVILMLVLMEKWEEDE